MTYFSIHNHSEYSNLKLIDSINKPKELIEYANDVGMKGVSLSDHESLSGHIKFLQAYKELKKAGKIRDDFIIALGNEIYLPLEDDLEELKENFSKRKPDTQFYHFLLTALDKEGHAQLRELSSVAWDNMFVTPGPMQRTPTLKNKMKEVIKGGHIVATTACLGGLVPQFILRWLEAEENNDEERVNYYKQEIHEFILYCIDVFGKDKFFFEIQPSENVEQHVVNKKLIELSKVYEIDYVIATDSHYLTKQDRQAHKVYLQSQSGDREVDAFYDSTYMFSKNEIFESMSTHLSKEEIQLGLDNTLKIYDMVEEYDLYQETIIPHAEIEEFELNHIFKPAYDKFEFIKKYAYSEHEIDRYYLYLIEEGFKEQTNFNTLSKDYFYKIMDRINKELRELWLISERLGDRMSNYYVLVKQIVELMWLEGDSIVGISRGSSSGFLTSMYLGIIQMNPLDYNLPHFRHLTAERPSLPDIDLDSEQGKRGKILQALKNKYGEDRVLNIATFSTEGTRSALLSACRGMGIDNDEASYLTNLIPSERGRTWSLKECYFGDGKKRKPVTELVNAVNRYKGLMDISLKIDGLIKNKSVHASGLFVYNNRFTRHNAMMRASSGQPTTQFDMKDSEGYLGNLKVDLLTVQNIDRIRTCMDLLIEDGYMDWQGNLRSTYDKYLHPTKLDYDNKDMWKMVGNNEVQSLFQFDTMVGLQTAQKIKPVNITELTAANTLMRLMSEGIQPTDKYIMFRDSPLLWEEEMDKYNLIQSEREVLKEHIGDVYGVSSSQEEIMLMSMDKRIANFSVLEADKLRKAVAKIDEDELKIVKELFFANVDKDVSKNLLQYVWDTQIMPQSGYGFNQLHGYAYSLIALQNLNLAYKYPRAYWNTACLTVDSNADEDSDANKSSDYGKMSIAIGNHQSNGMKIALPDINNADFSFRPNPDENSIIFGLKGISGVNTEIVHSIISNRPYTSFKDFLIRLFDTKLIQNTHVLQLIKAGCFDSFDTRTNIMEQYINHTFEPRQQLTMQSFNIVNNLNVIPSEYDLQVRFYNFRQYLMKLTDGKSKDRKTKNRLFLLDDISTEFFYEHFTEECVVDFKKNRPIVGEWLFEKEYEKLIQPLREWFGLESTVNLVNQALLKEEWKTKTSGSVSRDEMSSLSYYYSGHELEGLDEEKYGVVDYSKLPQEPVVTREYEYGGRVRQEFQIHRIAGTVLDKDKNRHTVTILTEHGVVTAKLYRNSYSFYDRQISTVSNGKKTVLERSWFQRGTLLMFTGFRRGNQFIPRIYRDSIFQHSIQKINSIDEHGNLSLTSERVSIE